MTIKRFGLTGGRGSLLQVAVAAVATAMLTACGGAGGRAATSPVAVGSPGLNALPDATGVEMVEVDAAMLDASIDLARGFLLARQAPAGNFIYEYDFVLDLESYDDNQVRQTATLWSLAMIHLDRPTPETGLAVARGIEFFRRHSMITPEGSRYLAYPGTTSGALGAQALLCMAIIDYLRSDPPEHLAAMYRDDLTEYVAFLWSMRLPEGQFLPRYTYVDGAPRGRPSPYYDGETLLALAAAARLLDRPAWHAPIIASAGRMYQQWTTGPFDEDPDVFADMYSFHHWGGMALLEMALGEFDGVEPLVDQAVATSDAANPRHLRVNRGSYLEGAISAMQAARLVGRRAAAERLARRCRYVLDSLIGYQVGGPAPNRFIRDNPTDDPRAIGGVQLRPTDSMLRIDITQHQVHALLLARKYLFD